MPSTHHFQSPMAAPESALFLLWVGIAAIAAGIGALMGMTQDMVAMLAEMPADQVEAVTSVLDSNRLVMFSIVGAIGGGVLSIVIYPIKGNIKQMAAKMTVSVISGGIFCPLFVFAPAFMEVLPWLSVAERTLIVSAVIAMFAWGTLQEVLPLAGATAKSALRWIFRLPPDHPVFGSQSTEAKHKKLKR